MTNHLTGPIGPIHDQRQIDSACLRLKPPKDTGDIGFLGLALFKLKTQVPLCVRRGGEDHHTRCVPIKPMHEKRAREGGLHTCDQAIGQMLALARNGQEAGGLIH